MEDARIAGAGQLSGGTYRNVKIAGSGKINGPIIAEEIIVMGASKFMGNVEAKTFKGNGGTAIHGNIKCQELSMNGAINCEGEISAELIKVNGAINVQNDINVGILVAKIEKSNFKNIYGEAITLKSKKHYSNFAEIEANRVEIINGIGLRVSAEDITILGKSEIGIVEYRKSLTLGNNVKVEKIIHL